MPASWLLLSWHSARVTTASRREFVIMLWLAADDKFDNIVCGLSHPKPHLDIVRVQDVGISKADDQTIFEWAFRQKRVLFTHDFSTLTRCAHERVEASKPTTKVFEVSSQVPIGAATEGILVLVHRELEKPLLKISYITES